MIFTIHELVQFVSQSLDSIFFVTRDKDEAVKAGLTFLLGK